VAGLHHFNSSPDTAASRGDWLAVLGLIVVAFLVISTMASVASDKRKTFKTGQKTPRAGEYRGEAKAFHGKDRTIAQPESMEWRLKEAYFDEQWLWIVLLLCVIGALCYSQINIPRAEEAVSHALGPVVSPPPPPRTSVHHVERHAPYHPRGARVHPHRRVREHHHGP
jgi:hypothetical protein